MTTNITLTHDAETLAHLAEQATLTLSEREKDAFRETLLEMLDYISKVIAKPHDRQRAVPAGIIGVPEGIWICWRGTRRNPAKMLTGADIRWMSEKLTALNALIKFPIEFSLSVSDQTLTILTEATEDYWFDEARRMLNDEIMGI
jgi:hypothetical protein